MSFVLTYIRSLPLSREVGGILKVIISNLPLAKELTSTADGNRSSLEISLAAANSGLTTIERPICSLINCVSFR